MSGHEGAYLAGVLAAKTTQTKARWALSFRRAAVVELAVRRFCPRRQGDGGRRRRSFMQWSVRPPTRTPPAAAVSPKRRSAPAPTSIFGQGDGASFGMLQAVETAQNDQGRQGLVHRRDRRQDRRSTKAPFYPRSSGTSFRSIRAMVEDLKADRFGTHPYKISLADNSVVLLHSKHIPDEVWAQLIGHPQGHHRRQNQDRADLRRAKSARADDLGRRRRSRGEGPLYQSHRI